MGQKTWICIIFQRRGLHRSFIIILSTPTYFHRPEVQKNQWHVVGKVSSTHVLGSPLIWGFHYMSCLPSGNYGTCTGSRSCFCWHAEWCHITAWLPTIESGWGFFHIFLWIVSYLGSSGTQWVIGLSWPPVRCHLMPPSRVIAHLSDPQ